MRNRTPIDLFKKVPWERQGMRRRTRGRSRFTYRGACFLRAVGGCRLLYLELAEAVSGADFLILIHS